MSGQWAHIKDLLDLKERGEYTCHAESPLSKSRFPSKLLTLHPLYLVLVGVGGSRGTALVIRHRVGQESLFCRPLSHSTMKCHLACSNVVTRADSNYMQSQLSAQQLQQSTAIRSNRTHDLHMYGSISVVE